jgi:autoinducer 2-degrading protein
MYVTCVHVHVRQEHVKDFIDATVKNHESSLKEAGNLRFDILQSIDDPNRFVMYEAYESKDAAGAHKKTEHYLTWKQTVAPYMAEPRVGVPFRVIVPEDRAMWK